MQTGRRRRNGSENRGEKRFYFCQRCNAYHLTSHPSHARSRANRQNRTGKAEV